MESAIEAVVIGLHGRRYSPKKFAQIVLSSYDLLTQWENKEQDKNKKAESFTKYLQDVVKSIT
jgi:hypothetical protein